MNNTLMATKLIEAGVVAQPSAKERVWRVVKAAGDRGIKGRDIARQLSALPVGSISSSLCELERRSMIYSRGAKGNGPSGKAKEYFTDMAHYEILPPPPKPKAAPKAASKTGSKPSQEEQGPKYNGVPHRPVITAEFNIDSLTIADAKAFYLQLKRMFG